MDLDARQLALATARGRAVTGAAMLAFPGLVARTFFGKQGNNAVTRALMRRHRQRGVASFLHVSEGNAAARRLYESMGFTARASLSMAKIERRAETRGDFLESS